MEQFDNISIDFGTSYSSASIMSQDGPVLIASSSSSRPNDYLFPTVAYVTENGEIFTSHTAERMRMENPSRYLFEFKLNIGIKGNLFPDCNITYTDVVAAILKGIKKDAETACNGRLLKNAVLTIPAIYSHNDERLSVMKEAAQQAGFSKIDFLSEPESAAIYYDYVNKDERKDSTVLVYDLGGGTFDPALIKIKEKGYDLLGSNTTEGNFGAQCGGIFFDAKIFSDLKLRTGFQLTNGNKHEIITIQKFCREDIKHTLTTNTSIKLSAPSNHNIQYSLSRREFETMISPLIDKTLYECDELLRNNEITWPDIDTILMVGGSCSIPFVREKLMRHKEARRASNTKIVYNITESNKKIDPEFAVCLGGIIFTNNKNQNTMNPLVYSEKRDELINILTEIIKIKEIPDSDKLEFETTKKRVQENQFNIVLVGEFQGGKSTTFNTFCDGREISPRGTMIKTSACKITAQNISDPSSNDYAQIKWKSGKDLVKSLSNTIKAHISPEQFNQLDMDREQDVNIICTVLFNEWNNYLKDKADYEQLDQLRIAILTAFLSKSERVKALRFNSSFSIEDISKMIVFPKGWENKWQELTDIKNGNLNLWENAIKKIFSSDEVIFAFIGEVKCYIKSTTLGYLGCTITDCPGLFASQWDTEIAQEAMSKADAILYLLGGSKEISNEENRLLSKLPSDSRVIFTINLRQDKINTDRIIETNAAKIKSRGFNIKAENIHRYQALLAFCAEFGKRQINKIEDNYSHSKFKELAIAMGYKDSLSIDQIWIRIVNKQLSNLESDFDSDVDGIKTLCEKSVNITAIKSGANSIFDYVQNYIVTNKAESILITNGSKKAKLVLKKIEAKLKNDEDQAGKNKAIAEAELIIANHTLEKFQHDVKDITAKSFQYYIYLPVIEDYYRTVLKNNIDIASKKAAFQIAKNSSNFTKEDKLGILIQSELTNSFEELIQSSHTNWCSNFKESVLRKDTIEREVLRINEAISSEWKNIETKDLSAFELSLPSGSALNDNPLFEKLETGNLAQNIYKSGSGKRVQEVLLFLPNLAFGITGFILAGVVQLLVYFKELWDGKTATSEVIDGYGEFIDDIGKEKRIAPERVKKFENMITPNIHTYFSQNEKLIKGNVAKFVNKYGDDYKDIYLNKLSDQRADFDKNISERRKTFELANEVRDRIAMEAKQTRQNKIEPMYSKIELFEKGVESKFNGN